MSPLANGRRYWLIGFACTQSRGRDLISGRASKTRALLGAPNSDDHSELAIPVDHPGSTKRFMIISLVSGSKKIRQEQPSGGRLVLTASVV